MKVFNIEDGKKKVYVQLNDVMMLMQFDDVIPTEVMEKHFMNMFIVTDENRFEFSEFTDPHTVEFFEQCDWIPDYKQYRGLSEEQIIECGQQIGEQMNIVAVKWNGMTPAQREKHQEVALEHEKLEFKMHSLAEILWTKQGHRNMPFPVVPDCSGFVMDNDDWPYIARQGINPTQVLIYRKDGKAMDRKKEVIPEGLVQAAQSILVDANLNTNEFFGDFENIRTLTDDGMYLVTTFKIIPKKEEVQEEGKENSVQPTKEKMTLAKRIKNFINKKRS